MIQLNEKNSAVDLTANPLGKFNGNEQKYVLQVLDSTYEEPAPWSQRLEDAFCELVGAKYAIACNSGTSGLHMALAAAGVGPGDEVISPALTVVMDSYATILLGATPVFADINPKTFNVDPEDVRRKITKKTKAIITVSLQGLSADMDPIMKMAKEHNLMVIEDSCQTMLGGYKGRVAGTIGHINVFSFEGKKHLTCRSEGGLVVTNDDILGMKARKFGGIGYKHLTARAGRTSLAASVFQNPDYERFDTVGLNYRMPDISAAVGLAQVERAQEIVGRRKKIGAMFLEAVAGCPWMQAQETPEGYENSYYTFAVAYHGQEAIGVSWREFYAKYQEMGGDGFYGACQVPYLEPVYRNLVVNGHRYEKGLCPIAERVQKTLMQFKCNYIDMDKAQRKIDVLQRLIKLLS